MISDDFRCFSMFLAVYDVFSWVLTFIESLLVRCITTPCAHILWSSLYVVGNLWQDQVASVGNWFGPNATTAIWKPLVAAFLSHLEVGWRFKVSVHLLLSPSGELVIGLVWDNLPTLSLSYPTFRSECWNLQSECAPIIVLSLCYNLREVWWFVIL